MMAPDPAPVPGPRTWPRRWFRPPTRWFRPPRRTVRLRLTLVYGALFLVLGTALLAITYLLVSRSLPAGPVTARTSTMPPSGTALPGPAVLFHSGTGICQLTTPPAVRSGQLQAQAQRCLSEQRAAELRQLLTESGIALAIMTVYRSGSAGWSLAGCWGSCARSRPPPGLSPPTAWTPDWPWAAPRMN